MEQSVIETIEGSDFYQAIIRKKETDLVDKRKAAAAALAGIDKDTDTRTRGLIKTIAAAEKTASEIEREAQEARSRVDMLKAEKFGMGNRAESQKRAHQDFLLQSADNRIDQAVQWFTDQFDQLRRGTADRQNYVGGLDLLHLTREISTVSNHAARVRALAYCRQSIKALELMKMEPELDQKKLTSLAEKMPDPTYNFSETTARKPEKDISDVPAWARFKSDDLHDLEMDDLLKRADSLRRKRA